jgi:O-antigen ligase
MIAERAPVIDGRWTAVALVALGIGAAMSGTAGPTFVALAILVLLGTAYAAYHWPRATIVAAALTTLLDPVVAMRVLPETLSAGPIGISEPLLAVAGVTAIATSVRKRGMSAALRDATLLLAALFIGVSIVSAKVNGTPPLVAAFGIVMTVDAIAIFIVWRALQPSDSDGGRAIVAIVAAGVAVAVFGIGQVVFAPNLFGYARVASLPDDVGRITSFLGNPNIVASVLGFVLPFPLFAVVGLRGRQIRWLAIAAAFLLIVALVLTYSRGAWIAVAAGLVLGALLIDWRTLAVTALLTGAAVGAVAVMPTHLSVPAELSPTPSPGQHEPSPPATAPTPAPDPLRGLTSGEVRIYWLQNGIKIIRDHPVLGVGPGRYGGAVARIIPSPVYDEYSTTLGRLRTVHNFWLHLGGEVGVVGLSIFLAMVVALVIRFVWAARDAGGGTRFVLLAGAATAAIVVAINSATEMLFEGNIPAVLIWLIFAVASTLAPHGRLRLLPARRLPAS